jgi:5-methylcytosine-specific restriction enzyme subunit McrC
MVLEESVTTIPLSTANLDRVPMSLNRMTAAYSSAVSLIRLLWESQGVSFAGTDSPIRIPGFLFDMNRFFQALLARFLGDHLIPFQMKEEQGLTGMM